MRPMRVASPDQYVPGQIAATPMAGAVAAGESARAGFLRDINTAGQAYRDNDGWVFPMEAHSISARV